MECRRRIALTDLVAAADVVAADADEAADAADLDFADSLVRAG